MGTSLPPPPPPVVPVTDVDIARRSVAAATEQLEETMSRASSFSEDERNTRVADEWSTIESLRHIVLVLDLWLSKVIRGEDDPFHPIGLPPSFMPPKLPGSSIDPDARPTFDDACEVVRGRLAVLGDYVETVTSDELARSVDAHAKTVGGGLNVILTELGAHNAFINRDLDVIESSRG